MSLLLFFGAGSGSAPVAAADYKRIPNTPRVATMPTLNQGKRR